MLIDGIKYLSPAEVAQEIGVSRQTLWRWRSEGHVPAGRRYRGRLLLFTAQECETIRQYSNRLELTAQVPPPVGGERESYA